jgi:hypothetical protein
LIFRARHYGLDGVACVRKLSDLDAHYILVKEKTLRQIGATLGVAGILSGDLWSYYPAIGLELLESIVIPVSAKGPAH